MSKQERDLDESGLPAALGAPARRALEGAGYTRLAQLAGVSETELLQLHGMGPKALAQLRNSLHPAGLAPLREKPRW